MCWSVHFCYNNGCTYGYINSKIFNVSHTVSPQGSVMISPLNITTSVNSSVNITCSGDGGPNNMFEWRKQGTVVVSNNAVLEFPMITGTDGAIYECTVSNAAGNETRDVTVTGMLLENFNP